jgi:hypothetical protein
MCGRTDCERACPDAGSGLDEARERNISLLDENAVVDSSHDRCKE